jgi:putative transposase
MIEMDLAGVSVRRVEDITVVGHASVALDGVGANKKIYGTIEAWRNRPIGGEHPYVYLDGIVLKRSWAGEVRLLVAIGVNGEIGQQRSCPGPNPPLADVFQWYGRRPRLQRRQ